MKKNINKIISFSLLALFCLSTPISAGDFEKGSKSFVKNLIQKGRKIRSLAVKEDTSSSEEKGSSSYTIDYKKRIVKVNNNKEKATVQFPKQKNGEIDAELEDGALFVGYEGRTTQDFYAELWHNEIIDINETIDELIDELEDDFFEYSYSIQSTKKYTILDITEYDLRDDLDDDLYYELEQGSNDSHEEYPDCYYEVTEKIRFVITQRNIFCLITECERYSDLELHEKYVNSFKLQ